MEDNEENLGYEIQGEPIPNPSDCLVGLVVTFNEDKSAESIDNMMMAIKMMVGVCEVEPLHPTTQVYANYVRCREDFRNRIENLQSAVSDASEGCQKTMEFEEDILDEIEMIKESIECINQNIAEISLQVRSRPL